MGRSKKERFSYEAPTTGDRAASAESTHLQAQWSRTTVNENEKPQVQVQVSIDDETAQGTYVNMASITHTETEFVLDFIYMQPQQPRARVRSRLITSPRHIKRLIAALQDSLARYEQRHGTVVPSGGTPPLSLN